MSTQLHYRRANADDFQQLKALRILAYGEFLPELTPDNQQVLIKALNNEDNMRELMEKSVCFVGEHDGYIAGMAFLMPSGNPTSIYPTDWAYIRMVGVDPKYRGMGLAKRLTTLCIEQARAHKEQTIGLHTSEMMHAARHIYESLGFEIVRELDPIFGKRYWLYSLDLSKK